MESHNKDNSTARAGDWLEVAGVAGSPPRRGEIREILGAPGHTHFRVRWDEGPRVSRLPSRSRGDRASRSQPGGSIGMSVTRLLGRRLGMRGLNRIAAVAWSRRRYLA